MKKRSVLLILVSIMMVCLTGCCSHEWEEATCTTPKTCLECGITQGEVEHDFNDATCTEAKICGECGFEEAASGHEWEEATCTVPKTCAVCQEIEGEPIAHSTKYGTCSMCEEFVKDVEEKDGYVIVTISDTIWMQENDDFIDVCVAGVIASIDNTNRFLITDETGGSWRVDVGTGRDFSNYIGKACEVYGNSLGRTNSTYNSPLINTDNQSDHIIFFDGKVLYPNDFDSEQQFPQKNGNENNNTDEGDSSSNQDANYENNDNEGGASKVWIPTNGGKKYHSKSSCSGMKNPREVTEEEAIEEGFTKCGRCW